MTVEKNAGRLNRGLLVFIIALSFIYLLVIPFGIVKDKLGIVEAVILILMLLILSGFIGRLGKFAISDKGFELQLQEVQKEVQAQQIEQERQKSEIDSLKFLISYFVTDAELKHLEGLAKNKSYPYEKADYFSAELRRLRSFGLIENFPQKGIRTLPIQGDLSEYFFVTERGYTYLKLRQQVDSETD